MTRKSPHDLRPVSALGTALGIGLLLGLPLGCGGGGDGESSKGRLSTTPLLPHPNPTHTASPPAPTPIPTPTGSPTPRPTPTSTPSPSPSPSPMPGVGEDRIAFMTNATEMARGDNTEIYTVKPDGTGLIRVTNNSFFDDQPCWSPDRTKIVFRSHRPGVGYALFVINADGTGEHALTTGSEDSYPMWSPDGTRIVFQSGIQGGEVCVVNSDGSGRQTLTSGGDNWQPSWSPDGTQIVFSSLRDWDRSSSMVNAEIYVMNADGSNVRRLTVAPGNDEHPRWSPDGTTIAFVTGRSGGRLQIWVMNAVDGSNQTQVTNEGRSCFAPTWSADSQHIAFARQGDYQGIYKVGINGGAASPVTGPEFVATSPAWSP